jgi:hypothetical protein
MKAVQSADAPLAPFNFQRRTLRANDIAMEVLYWGIRHTDLHQARNDWGWRVYPMNSSGTKGIRLRQRRSMPGSSPLSNSEWVKVIKSP